MPISPELAERLGRALGSPPVADRPLSGGCIADVARVDLADGRRVVVKHDGGPRPRLDIEAGMLTDLAATGTVRTPAVLLGEADLLVLEHIENNGTRSAAGGAAFARVLARLHAVSSDAYGYPRDTLIGSLGQPNPPSADWAPFFAEHRVRVFARLALDRRGISPADMRRLETLCDRTEELIGEPPARPAMIHGDLWSGNVLWSSGEVTAVIDPAIYYADPEIELAFIALMGCFGDDFFDAYEDVAGIRPGFWETRCDLYNLYPLLVHAALFGGGYGAQAMAVTRRLGF
jgi:fructosamine-3-kinase